MRGLIIWVLMLGSVAVVPQGAMAGANATPVARDYLIGAGDVLYISIWKEKSLTQDVVVRPDGKIVFPLIGDLVVAGKSPEAVQAVMVKKLKHLVPDPILTVSVRQINSLIIYVVGKVNQPGRFVLNTNIKVMQALAMAGGLNSFAKGSKIKIFRESKDGTKVFKFDYEDVSKGKRLKQNIELKRGDLIVVP